jgi:rare lipoprotein A
MLVRPRASSKEIRAFGSVWGKATLDSDKELPVWLLVGTSCLAMAGLLGTISTRTVQADVGQKLANPPLTVVVTGPTPAMTVAPKTGESRPRKILRGIASWYGAAFDGRQTASGETFNMYDMTACHPTLPFGSMVRVVNLRNKRSVVVRITDHSGLVRGRIIDLSYAAAEKLNMTQSGLARVSIEVLSVGRPVSE